MPKKTFKAWLKDQKYRADPVGNLAMDFLEDKNFPRQGGDLIAFRRRVRVYLNREGGEGAVANFERAFQEWLG